MSWGIFECVNGREGRLEAQIDVPQGFGEKSKMWVTISLTKGRPGGVDHFRPPIRLILPELIDRGADSQCDVEPGFIFAVPGSHRLRVFRQGL